MPKRITYQIDVTLDRNDDWGAVETKDLMKLFVDKNASIKNFSVKKVYKSKEK